MNQLIKENNLLFEKKKIGMQFVSLSHLQTQNDLTQLVKTFYKKELLVNESRKLLVIQCDINNLGIQKINYAKFIFEYERQKLSENYETNYKDVIFIVHVNPTKTNNQFIVDFNTPWKFVFIDEIRNVEPSLNELLKRPFSQHIQEIDLKQVVFSQYRISLSMLRYSNKHTHLLDLRNRIKKLQKLLNNEMFWNVLQPKLINICLNCFEKNQISFYSEHVAFHINHYFKLANNYSDITLI
jgi:hypothetical protein